MIAGFLMTVVSSPIDVIKTRVVNERAGAGTGSSAHYISPIDCMKKVRACVMSEICECESNLYRAMCVCVCAYA